MLLNNKNTLAALLAFTFVALAAGQIDSPRIRPEQDVDDLYQRAAASVFVVTGTVVKSEGIGKRMTPALLERMKSEGDLGLMMAGILYTIRVESTVCRQSDFHNDATSPKVPAAPLEKTAHIFIPRTSAVYPNEGFLASGEHELFFLIVPEQEAEWTKTFELDPAQVYYRAHGGYRGIVPILPQPIAKQPVLDKLTQLCQAVRPANVAEKLAALNKLAGSGDPILEKEANAAAEALQIKPSSDKK